MKTRFTMTLAVLTVVILAATMHLTVANSQNITPTFTTSRYVMFGGAYQVSEASKSSGGQENAVFKMDTYTGKAWILTVRIKADGGREEVWTQIAGDTPSPQASTIMQQEQQTLPGLPR